MHLKLMLDGAEIIGIDSAEYLATSGAVSTQDFLVQHFLGDEDPFTHG